MSTILETSRGTQSENSDERFVKSIWARILSGEDVRVWLHGFNWKVFAVCVKRGDILALTSGGWQLATRMSFSDVRLTKEYWEQS